MGRILVNSLTTDLTVTNSFGTWLGYPLTTTLSLSSDFSYEVVRGLSTPLTLSSEFTPSTNAKRLLTTTLVELSIFSPAVIRLNYLNTPIPTLDAPPDPVPAADLPHNLTDGGKRSPTTFSIYYQGVLQLTLNAPEFGDTETLRKIHVQEYTRGNTLISFRVVTWGEQKLFEYSFSWMNKTQKDKLLLILRNTLGRKIQIIDHLGITRLGYILTPETEIFEQVPKGFTATFRFQQVD